MKEAWARTTHAKLDHGQLMCANVHVLRSQCRLPVHRAMSELYCSARMISTKKVIASTLDAASPIVDRKISSDRRSSLVPL